jgi:hypothetical protein
MRDYAAQGLRMTPNEPRTSRHIRVYLAQVSTQILSNYGLGACGWKSSEVEWEVEYEVEWEGRVSVLTKARNNS